MANTTKRCIGVASVLILVLAYTYLYSFISESHHMTLEVLQTLDLYGKTTPSNTQDKRNQTWDVIISTYMRSGSTFLGKMLGHREDSFYWYEPMHRNFTWKYHREDWNLCHYIKPSCINDSAFASKALDTNLHFLSDFYKCRLIPHVKRINEKLHTTIAMAGPSWAVFRTCNASGLSRGECLAKLEPVCRAAAHRVTKVLRLDFSYIEKLLIGNPRLKAILLLRDPRGILSSQIHARWFMKPIRHPNAVSIAKDAEVMCSRMTRDIRTAKLLLSLYPDRVKIVQYEDFDDPVRKLKLLYSFLNMDASRLPLNVSNKPSKTSSSSDKSRDMFSYRVKLDWWIVQTVDSHCKNVYRELGLVQYKNEKHLRNVTKSPIIKQLPFSLETILIKTTNASR